MDTERVLEKLAEGGFRQKMELLYGSSEEVIDRQTKRFETAVRSFMQTYPERKDIRLFSAPGRTEIGGNHTDHQHGCVLAAAVNLDVIAVVSFHEDGVIRVKSEGYREFTVSLDELEARENRTGSAEIVRGIAAKFTEMGVKIGGFDMYSTSDVLAGSGISSSAAFETLIGTIIDLAYNNGAAGAVEIAKIGQFAENVYFGKKSGLMDQMVSSVGGLVAIDFNDTQNPEIDSFEYDFERAGYCLCITDTKGSHADLTPDYVSVPAEMESVAAQLGAKLLRDTDETEFWNRLPELRKTCTDRAIMRAAHFYGDNRRAQQEAQALKNDDITQFLALVSESGESSAALLQNLYSCSKPTEQAIPLGIMMSKRYLSGKGAVRVHGGGFAGTIQAFVPVDMVEGYAAEMNRIYGENSCYILRIRPVGGTEIK